MSRSSQRSHEPRRRKQLRLQGFDYSKEGLYFVTIDCKNMECRFGNIHRGNMILSDFGKIAFDEWMKLPSSYENVHLDVFQFMPNHSTRRNNISIWKIKNHFTISPFNLNNSVSANFVLYLAAINRLYASSRLFWASRNCK